jgi:hypothetical protein
LRVDDGLNCFTGYQQNNDDYALLTALLMNAVELLYGPALEVAAIPSTYQTRVESCSVEVKNGEFPICTFAVLFEEQVMSSFLAGRYQVLYPP